MTNQHNSEDPISSTVRVAQTTVEAVVEEAHQMVEPMRRSVLSRFPTLFLLLVTFGVTAVVYGLEQIISQYALLHDRPWLILIIGLGTLVFTGTLYKKLG